MALFSKLLAILVATAYIVIALMAGVGWDVWVLLVYLALPMACILFSDEMGDYSGMLMQGGPMTRTPGCIVALGGLFLLLFPAGLYVYNALHGAH